ncbi:MAG: hypothetical protein JWM39_547 [Parcubacteria group bacterium]|nr:hypothetical protein [Parcubacteria group bacterium]
MSRESDHNAKQLGFRLTLGLEQTFSSRAKEELVRRIKRYPESAIADFYKEVESLWRLRGTSEEALVNFRNYCEEIYPMLAA